MSSSPTPNGYSGVILKLDSKGFTPELISECTGLNIEEVIKVLSDHATDPQVVKARLASIHQESYQYRCAKSRRLLIDPAITSDGKNYEYNVLETMVGDDLPSSFSIYRNPLLKEQVQKFAVKTLEQLECYITRIAEPEAVLQLVGDCLSVFDPTDNFDHFAGVLKKVSNDQLQFLLRYMSDFVSQRFLRTLLNVAGQHKEFYPQALEMSRFFLLGARLEEFIDSDFEEFLNLLRTHGASSESFQLRMEVAKICNSSQLSKLRTIIDAGSSLEAKIELNFLALEDENCSATLINTLSLLHQQSAGKKDHSTAPQISEAIKAKFDQLEADIARLTSFQVFKSENRKLSKRDVDIADNQYEYSYQAGTSLLHVTNLNTDRDSIQAIAFQFIDACSWCILPGGSLCFSGGYSPISNAVMTINPINYVVTHKAPMLTARAYHTALYHKGYVYAIGGGTPAATMQCERYLVSEDRWIALSPLILATYGYGIVAYEESLYVLGGHNASAWTHSIQELKLESLAWRTLNFYLPSISEFIAVFRVNEECFLVHASKLYAFKPSSSGINLVKNLSADIRSNYGQSSYSKGTLYCSNNSGAVRKFVIGDLR